MSDLTPLDELAEKLEEHIEKLREELNLHPEDEQDEQLTELLQNLENAYAFLTRCV